MQVIGHDDIAGDGVTFPGQHIKPVIYKIVPVCQLYQWLPSKAGEGDEINISCCCTHMNRHTGKLQQAGMPASPSQRYLFRQNPLVGGDSSEKRCGYYFIDFQIFILRSGKGCI